MLEWPLEQRLKGYKKLWALVIGAPLLPAPFPQIAERGLYEQTRVRKTDIEVSFHGTGTATNHRRLDVGVTDLANSFGVTSASADKVLYLVRVDGPGKGVVAGLQSNTPAKGVPGEGVPAHAQSWGPFPKRIRFVRGVV